MTSLAIRKKLINYLSDAEHSKIKAIYLLLEKDIEAAHSFDLSEAHLEILDKDRALHFSGVTKSYSKEDSLDLVKGIKSL